ncbi:hypothetical protein NQ314_012753 [Rhamnusium bicolor]|uniref:Uncharacterized protein n=1 Tax=Rhamnusium bicolor TaxID=1586634 RepID=A0AAV8X9C3_9CUCU|nr:hypothetical protein NQ314_012753 [Rhamnusium bicolor]
MFHMTNNDMEQLCNFMGHTLGVHQQSYRLPDDVFQTAKISKLLLLMEKGEAGKYKGKGLEDINIDMDENLLDDNESGSETDNTEDIVFSNNDEVDRSHSLLTESVPSVSGQNTTQETAIKSTKSKRILVPWSSEQKQVVTKYFFKHRKHKIPPKKHECMDIKVKHAQLLSNKSWEKIKVFVQNLYSKNKH